MNKSINSHFSMTAPSSQVGGKMAASGWQKKRLAWSIAVALMAGSMAIPATGWAATDCNAVTEIPKTQCQALVSLYTSTNGAKWKDAATNNWNVTNTPCSWTGVVCSGGNVTELKRRTMGLAGPLPDLSALTGLQSLWLDSNASLTGDIAVLKGSTNLRILYLGYTGLRGFLGDLSTLTQLEELNMDYVPLSTPMPDLSSFKKLRILSIWQSGMVGLIPASLSGLTNLEKLNLGYNRSLTGNIPNLSALTKLSYLDLSSNNLTGNIPDMSSLIRLGYAYLSNNQLSGNIPASLGALPAPAAITLSTNNLCIPGEPLLSQLNTKTIPTANTTWATTQKSTGCDTLPLTVTKVGNGTVTSSPVGIDCGADCIETYKLNTAVTLTATPTSGLKFLNWSGACSGTSTSVSVTMDSGKNCQANFEEASGHSLTTSATNGTISCNGGTCQTAYPANTALTVTATPNSGYEFDSWGGACSGTSTCQVTMDAAKSVTASFSGKDGGSSNSIWPSCAEHARYSIEDYTLTVPVLEVPLLSFLGDPLGESLYYETVLKQVNGTNDRFVLQDITELVKVETDNATCAKFDLDQGVATLPVVDVKLPIPSPMDGKNYGFNTERYAVTLKWMPILGTEIFVVESINKIGEEERKP